MPPGWQFESLLRLPADLEDRLGMCQVGREVMHPPAERVRGARFPHLALIFFYDVNWQYPKYCESSSVRFR